MSLTKAYFSAQTDYPVWEITVDGLLQKIAANYPNQEALVEVKLNGELGRRWSYSALLSDSETLALVLSTRFKPGERVVV